VCSGAVPTSELKTRFTPFVFYLASYTQWNLLTWTLLIEFPLIPSVSAELLSRLGAVILCWHSSNENLSHSTIEIVIISCPKNASCKNNCI
jgi:hypothetical protein